MYIVVVVLYYYLHVYSGTHKIIYRFKAARMTDRRVKAMNEIISGIRIVKMYGWEYAFSQLVTTLWCVATVMSSGIVYNVTTSNYAISIVESTNTCVMSLWLRSYSFYFHRYWSHELFTRGSAHARLWWVILKCFWWRWFLLQFLTFLLVSVYYYKWYIHIKFSFSHCL